MWYAKCRMVAKACRTRGKILNKEQQGFRCSVEVLRNFAAIGVKNGSHCCEVNGRLRRRISKACICLAFCVRV